MKSFRCRPPILCVHQVTVTLPHSVNSAGWCPSSSACSPTLLVNANAWAKLRNLNTRSKRLMPSRFTTCHSGTCRRSSAISASVSVGSSPRQAVHFISDSSLILSPFLWARRLGTKFILRTGGHAHTNAETALDRRDDPGTTYIAAGEWWDQERAGSRLVRWCREREIVRSSA